MNVFSFVQWNKYFHSVKDEMFHSTYLSPHENICTIALINIHYLYDITFESYNITFESVLSRLSVLHYETRCHGGALKNKWKLFGHPVCTATRLHVQLCANLVIFREKKTSKTRHSMVHLVIWMQESRICISVILLKEAFLGSNLFFCLLCSFVYIVFKCLMTFQKK